jgi:uncharacterized membrane protein
VGLGESLFAKLTDVAGALWFFLLAPGALARLVVELAFLTVFLLYVQEIVDEHRNAVDALAGSWRLVLGAGFWRVVGNYVLFVVCVSPVMLAMVFLIVRFGAYGLAEVPVQLVFGAVVGSLSAAFLTTLYLLARGERAAVEAVVGPAGEGGRQAEARHEPLVR